MKHSRSVMFAVIIIVAALALTICGCGGQAEEYFDPNTPIVVEEGQEFVIVLESNPTTGYQWQLAQPLEEEVLSLVKTEFEEPEEELVGAGGEERWTFKAEGRGDTIIDFAYVRPWEEPEGTLEEEGEPVEISAPEEEGNTFQRTFVVEVKKEGSKGEEAKEYDNPETEIEVEQDFKFAILLESSPSAGYRWQLAQPLDESILELVKTEYESGEKEGEEAEGEEMVIEGTETWTFEAVGEGDTEIHFELVNTTEEDAAPEEEKEFKVKVHLEKEEEITEE
jgi:inhibitor of cysteine peptidase